MLQPKRVKYRKVQKAKGNMTGNSQRGNQFSNGMFGIKSIDQNLLTSRQIEAARIAATRHMKREGQLWIKIFPDKPITARAAETRMGSGKGTPEYWVAVIKPGRILYEIKGVEMDIAREAMRIAGYKMPVKTRIISTNEEVNL